MLYMSSLFALTTVKYLTPYLLRTTSTLESIFNAVPFLQISPQVIFEGQSQHHDRLTMVMTIYVPVIVFNNIAE